MPFTVAHREGCKRRIIADGSLLEAQQSYVRDNWHLDVIPDAELCDVARVLVNATTSIPLCETYIIFAGFTNNNGVINPNTDDILTKTIGLIHDSGLEIFCAGVPTEAFMKEEQKLLISRINEINESQFGLLFIPPPTQDRMNLTEDKMKFDQKSTQLILTSIKDYVHRHIST